MPSTMPQLSRLAAAPAVMAAAAEVPVRVVMGSSVPGLRSTEGPRMSTPGAASSGLISPLGVKPRLEWM